MQTDLILARAIRENRSVPILEWLGLGLQPPPGLHSRQRRGIVDRHTSAHGGGASVPRALAMTYDLRREARLMRLLRPQRLDDALRRQVYALIVTARRVNLWMLCDFLDRLTSHDERIAQAQAIRTYQQWSALVTRADRLRRRREGTDSGSSA